MIYLALTDFKPYIQSAHLDEITESDPLVLDDIELACIEEMKGYLNVRYDPEACFNTTNRIPIIKSTLLDLAIYEVHARISPKNIPTLRENRQKKALEWLEKTASGYIAPLLPIKDDTATPSTPLRYGSTNTKTQNFF
jgi:hypothetical protein